MSSRKHTDLEDANLFHVLVAYCYVWGLIVLGTYLVFKVDQLLGFAGIAGAFIYMTSRYYLKVWHTTNAIWRLHKYKQNYITLSAILLRLAYLEHRLAGASSQTAAKLCQDNEHTQEALLAAIRRAEELLATKKYIPTRDEHHNQ